MHKLMAFLVQRTLLPLPIATIGQTNEVMCFDLVG